jgi:hypothetical protein
MTSRVNTCPGVLSDARAMAFKIERRYSGTPRTDTTPSAVFRRGRPIRLLFIDQTPKSKKTPSGVGSLGVFGHVRVSLVKAPDRKNVCKQNSLFKFVNKIHFESS